MAVRDAIDECAVNVQDEVAGSLATHDEV
jgi:hypothetical protein